MVTSFDASRHVQSTSSWSHRSAHYTTLQAPRASPFASPARPCRSLPPLQGCDEPAWPQGIDHP